MLEHLPNILIWIFILGGCAIAFWNARAAGLGWQDSRIVGGYGRIVVWCGAIQSALGFSTVFFYLIMKFLESRNILTPEIRVLAPGILGAILITPALGIGIVIAVQRWLEFSKDQDTYSGRRALGTSVRQIKNMNAVAEIFSAPRQDSADSQNGLSHKNDGQAVLLAVLIAGIAVLAGVLAAYVIVISYDFKVRAGRMGRLRRHENAVAEVDRHARQIF